MKTRLILMAGAMALAPMMAAEAQNTQNNNRNSLYNGPNTLNNRVSVYQGGTTNNNRNDNYVRADGGNSRADSNVRIDGAGSGGSGGSSSNDNRNYAIGLPSYAAGSGPCIGRSTSVAAGAFGFGGGVGHTEVEEECQLREAARLMHSFGATGEALALIRGMPSVRKAQQAADQATLAPAPRTVQAEPLAPATVSYSLEVAPAPLAIAAWCSPNMSAAEKAKYRVECGAR